MLVIVSDFHFSDGTAVPAGWNVNPGAIELLLRDVYRQAVRKQVKELYLVLLGDMFDTLRSELWLSAPLVDRPWGAVGALDVDYELAPATRALAQRITRLIIEKNQTALDLLAGRVPAPGDAVDLELLPPPGIAVHRVFLPGNHDRLYLCDPEVRRLTREALNLMDEDAAAAAGIFAHYLRMPRYGLLARHGHEYDAWNFERHHLGRRADDIMGGLTTADYRPVPIGDPITTELVVGFPYRIRKLLTESKSFSQHQIVNIVERMQRIEDVRPTMAAFQWIFYETELLTQEDGVAAAQLALSPAQQTLLRDIMQSTLHDLSTEFAEMPFFHAWCALHDRLGCSVPEKIKFTLFTLRHAAPRTFARMLSVGEKLGSLLWPLDSVAAGATAEPQLASGYSGGMRFIVYGHTHEPLERALARRRKDGGDLHYADLYLNSGTWRDRVFAAQDGLDFARWRSATYIILYTEDENQPNSGPKRIGPAFDSWTGHRAND